MRAPLNWLREYADISADADPRDVAAALIRVGLEVETVDTLGAGLTGPLVVGQVREITELTEFRKPIRFCQVDVGPEQGGVRGIICGATNFAVDDLVPVALPGTVLPGGFEIAARKTYGHVSDGMICSAAELGLGDDHGGILVLGGGAAAGADVPAVGADAAAVLGIGEAVLDIAVTPDRGYCLSIRGLAREAAIALGVEFRDPAQAAADAATYPPQSAPAPAVDVHDTVGCPFYTAVLIDGVDPNAATPTWLEQRLVAAGMRSISLAVDVTNYVMLELGQPLHAFDAETVNGGIIVRRAHAGEQLETIDHVVRTLTPDDLLIADAAGPIGLAGTMGGLATEISETTHTIILEAAIFAPDVVARMARRHKLPSEASRRFERGVDPALPWVASRIAAELLVGIGGGVIRSGTGVGTQPAARTISISPDLPARISGADIAPAAAAGYLVDVGCQVTPEDSEAATADAQRWTVRVPTWRPDLRDPADVVEEVVRLYGYDNVPATLPSPPAGRGLTDPQRRRRAISRALASAGLVETLTYPFVGDAEMAALEITDERARLARLANPISAEQDALRTTLLPGLLAVVRRNVSRGAAGVGVFEIGQVFLPPAKPAKQPPIRPSVTRRPNPTEVAELAALLPDQPVHIAAVIAGEVEAAGVWGGSRTADWQDAVAAARRAANAVHVEVRAVPEAGRAPWHPGRCAALTAGETIVGYAGELHPRVISALGLPARTAAMELDFGLLDAQAVAVVPAPAMSTFPVVKEDIALIVPEDTAAADVLDSLVAGAGPLLESIRIFDEYRGTQIPTGHKSLAFAMRFRAADRTLSDTEVAQARNDAVARAAGQFGAVLRDS